MWPQALPKPHPPVMPLVLVGGGGNDPQHYLHAHVHVQIFSVLFVLLALKAHGHSLVDGRLEVTFEPGN